ncbi:Elongation factor 1-gamma 1 [Fusarium oxysporum f. sp. albedinis]|nr:Glutathione S-transferase alpha-2 [Fusarium oxysporum f. sp. albedinis]KAJ0135111.1 Elongation factor 1-gamma 1 [Fusarium oxysporum f. sp. albedinis]
MTSMTTAFTRTHSVQLMTSPESLFSGRRSRRPQLHSFQRRMSLGDQSPLHPIIKFMPLNKVLLITRFIRTFDHTQLDVSDESNLPKVFQAAEPWSHHIQEVASQLFLPGTNITIDECIPSNAN